MSVRELTARGRGGVAVLAVRGRAAVQRLAELAAPTALPGPGELRVLRLVRAGELVDEALCVGHAPDDFELHLHGSPPLVRHVHATLAGPAEPSDEASAGVEARAAQLLAGAASEAAARVLLDQAEGALTRRLDRLALAEPPRAARGLERLVADGERLRALFHPPRVVLAGPVNAGKSTLFNLLVGRERVVVSSEAGTTRDAIEERVLLGAYAFDLVDTAGERALAGGGGSSELERRGQRLARERSRTADLVLRLVPLEASAPPPPLGSTPVVLLRTRAGEARAGSGSALGGGAEERFAGRTAEGAPEPPAIAAEEAPEAARACVERVVREALGLPAEPWSAGAGVPFEVGQIERLRSWLGALPIESATRRGLLRAAVAAGDLNRDR